MSVKPVAMMASSALLLVALSGLGAAAPNAATARINGSVHYGGTLNVGVDSGFVTLDPALSSALIDRQAMINIFDPLLKLSPRMTIEPNLVTSWNITNGGKTYTLTLRKGVKFQDGTPFNAQAVIYNWRWEMNPANASPRLSNLTLVSSLSAPNSHTVVVNLKSPFSAFLSLLAGRTGMINSPSAMQKEGANYPSHPVGAGPFKVQSWNPEGNLVLVKNPYYWQKGKPYLNKVVYTPINEPIQEYNALITGQENLIDFVPYQDVNTLKDQRNIHWQVMAGLGYNAMELNTATGPLKNWHNRAAINYAINRKALINLIYFGHTKPAYEEYPPSSWAYNSSLQIPYSVADAKQQLKLAGDPQGFTITLQMDNNSTNEQMGEAIQSELAKVGITVKLDPLDFTTLLENGVNGNYQMNILGWSGRPDPDQNAYAFDVTGGSFNYPKYSNPQVNQLLTKAREVQSHSQRKVLYNKAAQILLQQAPYVFIAYTPIIQAWSTSLHGFKEYPDDLMRLVNVWMK